MNDLRDTRKHVGCTKTDDHAPTGRYALAASEAVYSLLAGNPNVELATLRFRVDAELPPKVTVTGRVGSLVGPAGDEGEVTVITEAPIEAVNADGGPRFRVVQAECPSCHQLTGRPPTDYCQIPDEHGRWAEDQHGAHWIRAQQP